LSKRKMNRSFYEEMIRSGQAAHCLVARASRTRTIWEFARDGRTHLCLYNEAEGKLTVLSSSIGANPEREVAVSRQSQPANQIEWDSAKLKAALYILNPAPVIKGWLPVKAPAANSAPKRRRARQDHDEADTPPTHKRTSRNARQIRLIMLRDGRDCAYCGIRLYRKREDGEPKATVDHVIPKSRGGSDKLANKVICCPACNTAKADMDPAAWMKKIWGDDLSQCPHELPRALAS
jgi:5-methylcytosine-specific restriction endonuclease McrA